MHNNKTLSKKVANHGVAWEGIYGYSQAVRVKDVIYVSGQLGHDSDRDLVAPAPIDANGKPTEFCGMEQPMRRTFLNATALLAQFGATLDNVVEETLYVLDVDAAFRVAGKVRTEFYGVELPQCASQAASGQQICRQASPLPIKPSSSATSP